MPGVRGAPGAGRRQPEGVLCSLHSGAARAVRPEWWEGMIKPRRRRGSETRPAAGGNWTTSTWRPHRRQRDEDVPPTGALRSLGIVTNEWERQRMAHAPGLTQQTGNYWAVSVIRAYDSRYLVELIFPTSGRRGSAVVPPTAHAR